MAGQMNRKLWKPQKTVSQQSCNAKRLYKIAFCLWVLWMLYRRSTDSDAMIETTQNQAVKFAALSPKGTYKEQYAYNASRLCFQNPYNNKLEDSLENVAYRVDNFLSRLDQLYEKAKAPKLRKMHRRFFPFDAKAPCSSVDCIGGDCKEDVSKIMCGADVLKEGCIIYSIGGNNFWEFEEDLLLKTPCQIHTFDCTGPIDRFQKPANDRLHFHHVCLGPTPEPANYHDPKCANGYYEQHPGKCGESWTLLEMQQRLHHSRIDLLKMDIEGFEWSMFESWPVLSDRKRSEELSLPMQLLVEVHYKTQFQALVDEHTTGKYPLFEFKHPRDMVTLSTLLMKMGYAVQVRDDNARCGHCMEITLTRFRCPATGVYSNDPKQL